MQMEPGTFRASKILGANIVAERQAQGLSREELAHRAGMDVGDLTVVEEGCSDPKIFSTVARIADALGVELPLLLEGM